VLLNEKACEVKLRSKRFASVKIRGRSFGGFGLRLTGRMVVMGFLCANADLLPGLTALAMSFDSRHLVAIQLGGENVVVVVRHLHSGRDHDCADKTAPDVGVSASTGAEADHVFHFARASKIAGCNLAAEAASRDYQSVKAPIATIFSERLFLSLRLLPADVSRPPPGRANPARAIESRILLI
jgi:hypothetical protein